MTPAVRKAKQSGIEYHIHQYEHDANNGAYGAEAAEELGLSGARVFKTLVVQLEGSELAVAVVPVTSQLSMKLLSKAAGVKKAAMATPALAERATGYVLGGVSPLGQKKRLRTFIDVSAWDLDTLFISGGRRGLEIELHPDDLLALTGATKARITQAQD